jgi:hypothetical protein
MAINFCLRGKIHVKQINANQIFGMVNSILSFFCIHQEDDVFSLYSVSVIYIDIQTNFFLHLDISMVMKNMSFTHFLKILLQFKRRIPGERLA